ncbi:unnamed protein product [Peniophora sp. CBMAI 1063]|nr:unnamed protein product [Peniophora sp. CBMAI 1063]
MSLYNLTKTGAAEEVFYDLTASFGVPTLLLDSFVVGVFFAGAPIGTYLIWAKFPARRALSISLLWLTFAVELGRWIVSLRQIISIVEQQDPFGTWDLQTFENEGLAPDIIGDTVFEGSLPLATETVLLGFSSFLFALAMRNSLWQTTSPGSRRFNGFKALIPAATLIMYTISLVHWAVTLSIWHPVNIVTEYDNARRRLVLLVLFSINVIISDAVVLWRMCVVWDKRPAILGFGAILVATTIGLNVANIVGEGRISDRGTILVGHGNPLSENLFRIYSLGSIGLVTVFVSLVSNFCATVLVGVKAWIHRRRLAEFAHAHTRRSLAIRVMELLVESGIVYTAALYCTSFLRDILLYYIYETLDNVSEVGFITAEDFLDVSMAQITSIYPLFIFMLVALDKIHYLRAPQLVSNVLPAAVAPMAPAAILENVGVERVVALRTVTDSERGTFDMSPDEASAPEEEKTSSPRLSTR